MPFDLNPDRYSREQLAGALRACHQLALAYEVAAAVAGGGDSINWDDIDEARDTAADALGIERLRALADHARQINEYQPQVDDAMQGETP